MGNYSGIPNGSRERPQTHYGTVLAIEVHMTHATTSTPRYQMYSPSCGRIFVERTIGISVLEAVKLGSAVLNHPHNFDTFAVSVLRDVRGQVMVQQFAPIIGA